MRIKNLIKNLIKNQDLGQDLFENLNEILNEDLFLIENLPLAKDIRVNRVKTYLAWLITSST